MTKNLITYSASAGSGKTYTLAVEFIALCLQVDDPGYFRRILAITFTNKAAEELKERILQFMHTLIQADDQDVLLLKVKELSGADTDQIRHRAEKSFRMMLYKYADLHVSTIDHFVLGILKAFSKELGLSFDFKVELDQGRITDLLIEELLKNIGRDPFITDALVSYAIAQLDEGHTWNPRHALADAADHLFKEHSSMALEALGIMEDEDIEAGMKVVQENIRSKKSDVLSAAELAKNLLSSNGLTLDDFEGKSKGMFSLLFKDYSLKGFSITESQHAKINTEVWGHTSSKQKSLADSIAPLLMEQCRVIDAACTELSLLESVYRDRLILLLAKRLHNLLGTLEKEEEISLLSGNNQRIAKVVKGNPAPFIYERLGERFKHFLIDEFQDTSLNQWHNFIPLLDNSLSLGNRNLLVGDAKQSIYRWRNSEVEQIIRLPDIHKKEDDVELNRIAGVFARAHVKATLEDNYRSAKAIVEFNNELFTSVAALLAPHLASAFEDVKQVVKRTGEEGYVSMQFLDKTTKMEDTMERTMAHINSCLADGYSLEDIAILVRKNKEGQLIAQYLEARGIRVNSSESLVLSGNDQVHLLLHLLQFVFQKERAKSDLFVLAHLLTRLGRSSDFHTLAVAYHAHGSQTLIPLFHALDCPIYFSDFDQENIYQAAEHLCRSTWIDDRDPYVQELLDLLFNHCKSSDGSLDAFLEFFERKTDLSIKANPSSDAVQLMTVHRSKGLQFPVVILPYWKQKIPGRNAKKAWFHWDAVPFPVVPLRLGKKLIDTQFEKDFTHEQELLLMDEVNALYVATTRAEKRLYLSMLNNGNIQENVQKKFEDRLRADIFTSGMAEKIVPKVRPPVRAISQRTKTIAPREILRTSSKKESPYAKARTFGEQVHALLESCDDISELSTRIALMSASLKMTVNECFNLEEAVKAALKVEEELGWKAEGFKCLKEQEVLSPDGKLNRMDRLYLNSERKAARILDYKTGSSRSTDETQMRHYINVVSEMGFTDVKAYLLYTQELKLIPVG